MDPKAREGGDSSRHKEALFRACSTLAEITKHTRRPEERRGPRPAKPVAGVEAVFVRLPARKYSEVRTHLRNLNVDISHIKWYSWVGKMVLELLVSTEKVESIVEALSDCQFRVIPDFDPASPPASLGGKEISEQDRAHIRTAALKRVDHNNRRRQQQLGQGAAMGSDAIIDYFVKLGERAHQHVIPASTLPAQSARRGGGGLQ